jgi:hypothetical protein
METKVIKKKKIAQFASPTSAFVFLFAFGSRAAFWIAATTPPSYCRFRCGFVA